MKFGEPLRTRNRIYDYSSKPKEKYDYKLYQYYVAEKHLIDYNVAIALFGTRRLGKTVTLNQLWDKFHTDKSLYIKLSTETTIDELMNYIMGKKDIDYLFIDEFTNLLSLDTVAADILDYCSAYQIKMIVSGTNSFLLASSLKESACGRFNLVCFNPQFYPDLFTIKGTTIDEFMTGKNTFYIGENYLEDISRDIIKSIDYLGNYKNEPLVSFNVEELLLNIQIIVELVILRKQNKLPRQGLVFIRKYYKNLDFNEVISKTQSKKEIVYYVFNILISLSLLIELPIKSFSEEFIGFNLYITTPLLYEGLLRIYNKEALNNKLGVLFESLVISQLYQLFRGRDNYELFVFRDELSQIEYDLAIEDKSRETIYLNEIKYSSSKYGKYKNNDGIDRMYAGYNIKYIDINPDNLSSIIDYYKGL